MSLEDFLLIPSLNRKLEAATSQRNELLGSLKDLVGASGGSSFKTGALFNAIARANDLIAKCEAPTEAAPGEAPNGRG